MRPNVPALLAGIALCSGIVGAQASQRDTYYSFLPPTGPIVGQTLSSARFELYGDRGNATYADSAPLDGIDDERGARLLAIAERFSPILRRNTFIVPRDIWWVLGPRPILEVDHWVDGERVRTDSVHLTDSVGIADSLDLAQAPSYGVRERASETLAHLVARHWPGAPRGGVQPPGPAVKDILFFDTPGDDAASWRRAYADRGHEGSRIYAHFFIEESTAASGPTRYALVIQFWTFYPYNDSANNHEGDWEGLNVCVTTRARAHAAAGREYADLLTASEVASLLEARGTPLDSLVIASVDYYFHHHVMTLNYTAAASGMPLVPLPGRDSVSRVWEDLEYVDLTLQRRLTAAGGRLATHPIGYIGGNSKGPDELLAPMPRGSASHNRNSGATYPMPGIWQTVGPFGVTEKIHGEVVPPLRRDARANAPWDSIIADPHYLTYRAADITLLPDWERVEPLIARSAVARRQWAWLVLPVRWGFPIAWSPGATLAKHADMGNLAPFSPPYSARWNRRGATAVHRPFRPRVLRTPLSPTTPWQWVRSGWGILNYPLAGLGMLPGYNVLIMQSQPWLSRARDVVRAPSARTFTPSLPVRFSNEGQGVALEMGGRDFARMLPGAEHPQVSALLAARDGYVDASSLQRDAVVLPRLSLDIHMGRRLAVENTFSFGTSTLHYTVRERASGEPLAVVRGRLRERAVQSGFRVDRPLQAHEALSLFGRFGFGWTWYELRDASLTGNAPDAEALANVRRQGGYYPPPLRLDRWWPNTLYAGLGMEAFTPKPHWLARRLGVGVRLEAGGSLHRLSGETFPRRRRVNVERGEVAGSLIFGW